MKVIPIIPTLNPSVKLLEVVELLEQNNYEKILIVDDGSDKKEIFDKLKEKDNVIILTHDVNKGKGCALKTAYKYYLENLKHYSGVITLDDDLQHDINDVLNISKLLEDNNMFIIGTRLFNTESTPVRNKLGNRIASDLFKTLYGIKIKDTQTGLRAIPNYLIPKMIEIAGDRFEYEMNVLAEMAKMKEKIFQVDIKTVYLKNSNKTSHFKPFKDSVKVCGILFKSKFKKK